MTPADRAAAYHRAFPTRPPLCATDRWLYGVWHFGNNYRGSGFYGAYPPDYLRRVRSLFPDVFDLVRPRVLHLCKGSLSAADMAVLPGVQLDLNLALRPDVNADAQQLPFLPGTFDLIVADPPYGPAHAARYGFKMLDRKKVFRDMARVTAPGGHVVWLDAVRPMYRKSEWHEWGSIGCWRSINHMIRGVTIFTRTELAPAEQRTESPILETPEPA